MADNGQHLGELVAVDPAKYRPKVVPVIELAYQVQLDWHIPPVKHFKQVEHPRPARHAVSHVFPDRDGVSHCSNASWKRG
jgi:hypothetical protein